MRVYVEPIAHLAGLSEDEIDAFLEENFGPLRVEAVVGHERILPADVSIATNWPTAYTVAQLPGSLFKFYFVQDFEPEFYEETDPLYRVGSDSTIRRCRWSHAAPLARRMESRSSG